MTDRAIDTHLREALGAASSSDRLKAALDAGTYPNPGFVPALIEQCAIEPDFAVREMLTWALLRHPADLTVPLLVAETRHGETQARSQALHSLSKIADPRGWEAISPEVLLHDDESIARTAWRAAAILAPEDQRAALAATLVSQLGRGGRDVQHSLSRALVTLGAVSEAALTDARASVTPSIRLHAIATGRLLDDPDESFDTALFEAERIIAFGEG